MLTAQQVEQYRRDGYLVVPGWAGPEQLQEMRQRAEELVDMFDPESISVFSTRNQSSTTDDYFLESASNVSFFFEEKAFDAEGKLRQPKGLSINKIGHAMHDLDPVFREFSRSSKISELMRDLGYRRPLPVQSMYIFKQPKIGGEVVAHQDSTFLYTDPPSVTGIWIALEDATVHNGCLWTLPGSHIPGVQRRFCREGRKLTFDKDPPAYDLDTFTPLPVKAGDLVVLDGANVHYSHENSSPHSRHAYSVHYVEGTAEWAPQNWMQRRADLPFEPLYTLEG
ncbi:hypothetical protein WJX72_009793 [[Myrmecia] bisecta]|uniref:Phytanoyl-CoA dioxygenase n=1 Tax=[Myrmecia] bisecta TaxID=41462 RepID=A0AAW1Q1S6_9CHLO